MADSLWQEIREDALQMCREERELLAADLDDSELLSGLVQSSVLQWPSFVDALSGLLAAKLGSRSAPEHRWHAILRTAFINGSAASGAPLRSLILEDLTAIKERDPACPSLGHAFLFFKGFHGIQLHRAANWLWRNGRKSLASLFQSQGSELFGMDIHPAAHLGSSLVIDHATGIVIGETARVGNGCTLLHGVTLGGNGKQQGDRHPKLGSNVLVGAGASILGNVKIGDGAKIGASAVVLTDIPAFATAVGCPAKVIGRVKEQNPASALDHLCQHVERFDLLKDPDAQPATCYHKHSPEFADQLQNVGGLKVSKEEAMSLFFERKRGAGSRLRKYPSEKESLTLQYAPTCVCST